MPKKAQSKVQVKPKGHEKTKKFLFSWSNQNKCVFLHRYTVTNNHQHIQQFSIYQTIINKRNQKKESPAGLTTKTGRQQQEVRSRAILKLQF
jgi:hypothetical protein